MSSPGVTLTATLQDVTGAAVGSAANPSTMRITLCGAGAVLPRIIGTSMIAAAGPILVQSTDGSISTSLWGNDVITPADTFYEIALLDGDGNIVQAGIYQFNNSDGTVDLSNATQLVTAPTPLFVGYKEINPASGALAFNGQVANTWDLTLGGDVTGTTESNFAPGTLVAFLITNTTYTFTWGSDFVNPPAVADNATTTALFIARSDGKLYAT